MKTHDRPASATLAAIRNAPALVRPAQPVGLAGAVVCSPGYSIPRASVARHTGRLAHSCVLALNQSLTVGIAAFVPDGSATRCGPDLAQTCREYVSLCWTVSVVR